MPLPVRPRKLEMDASAHCQLACPSCPTASGAIRPALGAGHLKFSDFKNLLDRNSNIDEIELSNYGEMFLNPELPRILEYAAERKVVLHADNGVNLNFARDETLEALVKYKFRSLSCSIDGATNETYAKYRVNGDLDRVVANIEKIREFRRKHNTGLPALAWQFIVFGHNEHEIEAARAKAAELGMLFKTKISWDSEFSPIQDRRLVQIQTGSAYLTREEFRSGTGVEYSRGICLQMWNSPVLNWDGRVLGCCRNFWGDFGSNAFIDGFWDSVNNPMMDLGRQMLQGQAEPDPRIPCTTCELYTSMQASGRWITPDEIKAAVREPGISTSIVVLDAPDGAQTAEVFVLDGQVGNPKAALQGARARSTVVLYTNNAAYIQVPEAGLYTVCVQSQGTLTTAVVRVDRRPVCQEFLVGLGPTQAGPVVVKAGRNDACPCGSGKKFKRCCAV